MNTRVLQKIAVFIFFQSCCLSSFATVSLPKIFTDSMVVQRDKPIKIWGWAAKDEKVSVKFHNQRRIVQTDQSGQWNCILKAEPAGGPYKLIVFGKNTVTFNDILVGDVWLCSGQSNMEFEVASVKNAAREIEQADFKEIRQYKLPHQVSGLEENDLKTGSHWETATPGNIGRFSAVAYFFARSVYRHTHVPIGLVNDNWGGTNIETWISHNALMQDSLFNQLLKSVPAYIIDSLTAYQQLINQQKIKDLQNGLPGSKVIKEWKNPAYDDSKWPEMELPGIWRMKKLGSVNGVVWFRKIVRLTANDAGKAILELPYIIQSDSTFVNGIRIGSTLNQPQSKRRYVISPGILKQGDNVISVRISDSTNTGGMPGDSTDMALVMRDTTISLAGNWRFQVEQLYDLPVTTSPNNYPSLLYNAMIHPIINLAIKGVIWYQGESNVYRADDYATSFPMLIKDWRQQWGQGNLPFLFVQLSSFDWANGNSNTGSTWAELREAQTKTLSLPYTGMAVTIDIGESHDIHPKNKQEAGNRLAAIALNKVYGLDISFKGPSFSGLMVKGDSAIVSFDDQAGGLRVRDRYAYLKGFELAGADHVFHYAKAMIQNHHIVVYAPGVPHPLAVRYAWSDDAGDANLYNEAGFPAVPFRTDHWKSKTNGVHYKILELL